MELAACAGMSIDVFFPPCGTTAAAARAVCSTCKVQPECLDYARSDSDTMGFGEKRRSANGVQGRIKQQRTTLSLLFHADLQKS
jgi:hypothetical protein